MNEIILQVTDLRKTFKLSRKQQQIEKTATKVKKAVDGLTFSAYKGEIYGLLGPNGAGKTTTLRSIATLIKPDSGSIKMGDVDGIKDPDGVRQKIGFMTGELKLEGFFTPNYLFDFFAGLHGMSSQATKERKKNLFEKFGIDRFAHVKVNDLSTGMKQKVSLVISIVHDPEIVIFDEPTNGLDVLTAKTVTDFLMELKRDGKTIILSTHIFSLVEKLCDRVGIIIDGKMIKEGTLDEITGGGENDLETVFFDVYDQVKGGRE